MDTDPTGSAPLLLFAAANKKYSHAAIVTGANPNKSDGSGRTPLLEAVGSGQTSVALKMLEMGASSTRVAGFSNALSKNTPLE